MGAKKANGMNKAEFVRGQPRELSGKEVVAKAKEAGLTLSEAYVYKVRATEKTGAAKGEGGKKSGPSSDRAEKKAFVAKYPPGTPATTIAADARKAGLAMSEKFVYKLRSGKGARGSAKKASTKTGKGAPVRAAAAPARAAVSSYEETFARAIIELGWDQVQRTLTRVHENLLRAVSEKG